MSCLRCALPLHSNDETPIHGFHPACFLEEFDLQGEADFSDLFEQATQSGPRGPQDAAFKKFNSSFFHGRYKKYSATLDGSNYILKMQQAEYPELPAIEFACNRIARLLGLQIPDHHFIFFENKAPTFVTRNFMDQFAPATLDHIYKFLDLKDGFTCEVLCKIIQTQTGRLSEVHRFVELCLFDGLTGNNDRHGRNIGFITRSAGVRILSPFYDNPSYIGIADELLLDSDLQPRGTIYTSASTEPTLTDYINEFRRLDLSDAVERFRQKVNSRTRAIIESLGASPALSVRRRNALLRLIEKRLQEFEHA